MGRSSNRKEDRRGTATFDPERDSYGHGFKAELLNRKLTATAAVFQVRQAGILTSDPLITHDTLYDVVHAERCHAFPLASRDHHMTMHVAPRARAGKISMRIPPSARILG